MSRRLFHALLAIVFLLSATRAEAQTRPDLSGTWTATKDTPAAMAAAPGPVLGQQFALRHEGQTLTIIRRVRDVTMVTTYVLDGREVRSRIPAALCVADSESIETAAWDGNAISLAVVGSVAPGGGAVTRLNVRRVLRLDAPDTLIVEGSMREGAQAASRTVGTVYKRTSDPMPVATPAPAPQTPATIAQVAWLPGVWVGTGGDERWTPSAGGSMLAVARTVRNGVMSSFEFLCIVERNGGLVYQAMPNGRMPATDFTLTRLEPNSATFENPAHDFPKSIRYTLLPDGTLEAVISGDPKQRALTFTFKRQQP